MHNKASFIEFLRQQNDRQPKKLIIAFGDASNDIPAAKCRRYRMYPAQLAVNFRLRLSLITKLTPVSQHLWAGSNAEAALALASDIGDVNYKICAKQPRSNLA